MDEIERVRRRLAALAWLLDNSIALPGTRFRIGLDAVIGLIPGFGDLVGALLSTFIVREAARVGAPPSVLTRMAFNVVVEGLVGFIPVLGDVFDAAWKSNQRNVVLLEEHLQNPRRAVRSSRLFVALLIAGLVIFIVITGALAFLVARFVWHALSG